MGLEALAVAALFGILTAAFVAGIAEVFLLAVWSLAIKTQMITAAVAAKDNFRNHSNRPLPNMIW